MTNNNPLRYECSYWEHETFLKYIDVAVIGSGIVGLTAAIQMKMDQPGLSVAVLERGTLPIGASTRNAGFACFGSMTELLEDLSHSDEDTVLGVVEKRWQGLQRLRALVGDEAISYAEHGGYEVFKPEEEAAFAVCKERMIEFNEKIGRITGHPTVYRIADERIRHFGFAGVQHLVHNQAEGQVHTGKMMQQLMQKAMAAGVQLFYGFPVSDIEDGSDGVSIMTGFGWTLRVPKVLVCVNGFAARLLGREDVWPARNQVLITRPIGGLKVEGCFHYDRGYFYFRNQDGRLLLGGGRNLDPDMERSDELIANETIRTALLELMRTVILPDLRPQPEVDFWWTGILGLGPVKKPIVERISPNVTVGVRLSGMGVAIGTLVGQEAAKLTTG
jgi:gamma-glutamylputrescine oxidase